MRFWFFLWIFWTSLTQAAVDPSRLLPAEKAFSPQIFFTPQEVTLQFTVADGYYLYRSKIHLEAVGENLHPGKFPTGLPKEDRFMGKQEIYRGTVTIPFARQNAEASGTLILNFQGCADVGVCYPPHQIKVPLQKTGIATTLSEKKNSSFLNDQSTGSLLTSGRWAQTLFFFFIAGIALSFTACMYPLLPIVSGIVIGQKPVGSYQAGLLAFWYVQGLAVSYTLVGVIAGLTGSLLTVWLQQPWVIFSASALLVLLALSMFGVFSIQMPSFIRQALEKQNQKLSGGYAVSVFFMGIFSALIIGPCVAPPLAVALGYIGQRGSALLGAASLYCMALGLGLPLIVVSVLGTRFLPRAGLWMRAIQITLGFFILCTAIYLITPFVHFMVALAAYVVIFLIAALWLFKANRRYLALLLLIFAIVFAVLGGIQKPRSFFQSLNLTETQKLSRAHVFTDSESLNRAIIQAFAQENTPVYVDFYADWCASCRVMHHHVFSDDKTWQYFDKKRFFTVDVTQFSSESQALLQEYKLFGPPGLFMLKSPDQRTEPLVGEVTLEELIRWRDQQK